MILLVCLCLKKLASAMCRSSKNVAETHPAELKKFSGAGTCAVCVGLSAQPAVCCVILNFA